MSNTKTVMGQAANTQGIPLDITDVFSTYLYTGNSASQPINNGVDLNGEGGMVWLKARTSAYNNIIVDSVRGSSNGTAYNPLFTNLTNAENTAAGYGVTSFNSNGFTLGPSGQQVISNQGGASYGDINYASWTFRKAPKFFDVVTYTGDGAAGREIAHNLGSVPGFIVVKKTNASGDWVIQHRSLGAQGSGNIRLNSTDAAISNGQHYWGDGTVGIDPTSSVFTVDNHTWVNNSGDTYVAYLFAHNDGDGGFGPSGDQDIIKCGSYTGNGSSTGPVIDLGFEPQWLLVKNASASANWTLLDVMRGLPVSGSNQHTLLADSTAAELVNTSYQIQPLSGGFQPTSTNGLVNASGNTYIYMAIRRGPLAQPESGTEVFAPNFYGTNGYVGYLGAPADMHMLGYRSGNSQNAIVSSRMIQGNKALVTSSTAAEITTNSSWDNMSGVTPVGTTLTTLISYTWKRAPGFFDVVAYSGFLSNGASGTIPHNLSVAPELMIFKNRSSSYGWYTWHTDLTAQRFIQLNSNAAETNFGAAWATADENNINIGFGHQSTSLTGNNYIAYLFATVPGVSKVGSYTGNGSSQTIDCGFTSGARFVLIKRTDSTGDWYVWDTERGIVAGNDPHLSLNTTATEVTSDDSIDPDSSGFIVNQVGATNINVSSATYIFYAIA